MNLNEILEDPGISCWLKDAIKTAYERDPVDALHDARRLWLGLSFASVSYDAMM
jgi:hypothetical protein